MTITAAQLMIQIGADTSAAQSGIGGLAGLLTPGGALGLGAAGAAAAVIGLGAASIKMAGDFQEGMTSLVTGAGESKANLQLVSDGILQMANDTGTSTSQLISGMYMIESAGYHGAAGLQILQAAAEGAKVGQADLGTVADATTTIMKDYPNVMDGASGAVNLLIATVASGKTHMADLAAAMAQILPTASAAGVGLNDVMGAMATMTGEGVPAANAATYLRQTILALEAPSAGTVKALKAVGLSSSQVAAEMHKSLPDAIAMITDAVGKKFPVGSAQYVAALKSISGGSKQMQGILDLSGTHLKEFQANTKNVTSAVKDGHKSITGWSEVQGDWNQKMAIAKEHAETLGIQIGTKLIGFLDGAANSLSRFTNFLTGSSPAADALKVVLITLGGALAGLAAFGIAQFLATVPALIDSFYTWAAAAWTALTPTLIAAAPFIAIGAAIALVAIGIYELVTHWKQVSAWLTGVWHAVITGVGAAFQWLGTEAHMLWQRVTVAFNAGIVFIKSLIERGFNFIKGIIQGDINFIVNIFKWLYDHNTYFKKLVDAIVKAFTRAKEFITTVWTTIVGWVTGTWHKLVMEAHARFMAIYVEISARITQVRDFLTNIWTTIVSNVTGFGQRILTSIQGAWNSVVSFITGINSRIISAVKSGVTDPIKNEVANLVGLATSWGTNLIQNLINGITNMAGKVKDAASNIANGIKNVLGFHSPAKEGPGSDADTWAPNLMRMFAQGLTDATPALSTAAAHAMAGVKGALMGSAGVASLGVNSVGLSPAVSQLALSPASQMARAIASSASGASGGAGTPIILQLDGMQVGMALLPHLGDATRILTGVRTM